MPYNVTVPPSVEPLTLAEMREHLRLVASGSPATHPDDTYIQTAAKAARAYAENETGRALVKRTIVLTLNGFDGCPIVLPFPPLLSVASVKYLDTAGVLQTWDAANYRVQGLAVAGDETPQHGRIFLEFGAYWPTTREVAGDVQITYTAGYPDDGASPADLRANIPEGIKQAIKVMLGHWYSNRLPVVVGAIPSRVQDTADALLAPFMVSHLAARYE